MRWESHLNLNEWKRFFNIDSIDIFKQTIDIAMQQKHVEQMKQSIRRDRDRDRLSDRERAKRESNRDVEDNKDAKNDKNAQKNALSIDYSMQIKCSKHWLRFISKVFKLHLKII